ncbi:hypothetical protein JTB14_026983 [Gonioctena quinquepunctata]|nr:hypothetical protein JTB14_026983 [Gonioctena quinquepunctata]
MSSGNESKAGWRIVNHERNKNKLNQPINDISPNEFNDFFVGIAGNIINSLPNLPAPSKSFFLKPVTPDEILETVTALKNSKCLDAYALNSNMTLEYELIKWPTEEECIKIESGFKKESKFPDIVGASLYRDIVRNGAHKYFFGKYYLVADSAYQCKSLTMTPYKFAPGITQPQRKYNKALCQQRVVIKHSFGQLKGRWRILQYINAYTIERAVDIVVACCTLHNFCLDNNDVVEKQFQDPSACDDFQYMGYVDVDGAPKREEIVA